MLKSTYFFEGEGRNLPLREKKGGKIALVRAPTEKKKEKKKKTSNSS